LASSCGEHSRALTLATVHEPATATFDEHLDWIHAAPADQGRLELIVRRPPQDEREVLDEARLDLELGLVGDRWATRDLARTPLFLAAQLTIIGTRLLATIEPDRSRWPLAGDQLYVDLDLCEEHLPSGSRLAMGSTIVEVTETPHTGCAKFSARFGSEALRWINSPLGRALRLRGLNARIVEAGTIRVGDIVHRV